MGCDVHLDGRFPSAQVLASVTIARVANAGDPLRRLHLQHGCACANTLPYGARCAERTHTPVWGGPIRCLRECPLTCRFACPIALDDVPAMSLPIPPSGGVFFAGERTCQETVQNESPQGFDRLSGQRGEQATEGRGCGHACASEHSQ